MSDLVGDELLDRARRALGGGATTVEEPLRARPARLDAVDTLPAGRRKRGRGWLVRRLLAAADVVALCFAFGATEFAFSDHLGLISSVGPGVESLIFLATLPLWVLGAHIYGLYDHDNDRAFHSTVDELVSVFHLVTVCVWGFFAFSWLSGLTDPNQQKLATFWLLAILSIAFARGGARALARRTSPYIQNTVIVGAGTVGQLIGRKLFQHPEYGMRLLGFVDSQPKDQRGDLEELLILGDPEELAQIVSDLHVDRVILAFSNERHNEALESIRVLRELSVQVDIVPRLYEAVGEQIVFHSIEGLPLLGLPQVGLSRASRLIKRGIDFAGSAAGLLLIAPLFAAIAVAVRIDSPGPVFFRQRRLGMGMREFTVLKFRTMKADTDESPHREYINRLMTEEIAPEQGALYKLARPGQVTRVGRFLRKTSLDEIPQLVNVLRGDMSLVGPRPCIPYETDHFKPHHFERFRVPAGLTGLWQVTGRAHTTFGDALDLDVAYARSWSLGLDLRLLARTPLLMLFGDKETK
ncbi:MAG: sugar transferase [Actinobacteria bacterium]|nr:sugar transferase [Actinomycetota bacterium]